MAALTQDAIRKARGAGIREVIAIGTSGTVYIGSLCVRRNTTGRALAGTAATGRRILGVAKSFHSDTTGQTGGTGVGVTGGTEKVEVEYGNEHLFAVKTAIRTNTSLGLTVYLADDNMIGGTAVGTSAARVAVGRLAAWEASDKSTAWVAVAAFGHANITV